MLIYEEDNKKKNFAFSFKTNNLNDLLCFSIHLIDNENKEIELLAEKKIASLKVHS